MIISNIRRIDKGYSITVRGVLIFLMTAIPIISGMEVVFRYILRSPLIGSNEILVLFEIWLYFLGFASAARERSHITARVVEGLIKTSEGIARLRMINAFIGTFICSYMVYMAWDYFEYSARVSKTTSIIRYPMLWYEGAALVCFVPALLYTAYEFYYYMKKTKICDVDLKSRDGEIEAFIDEIEAMEFKGADD